MSEATTIRVVSAGELLSLPQEPLEWFIQGLVPTQSITVISGDPGNYKTWFSLEMTKCAASGQSLFGKFPVKKYKVLIVDRENRSKHIQVRLFQNSTPPESDIHFVSNETFHLDKAADFNGLVKKIEELGIGLVIFDSLVRLHSGDENNSRDMAAVLEKFQRIAKRGVNVVFLHHLRKGSGGGARPSPESLRGSGDINAAVDCHLRIERLGEKPLLKIEQLKLRQDKEMPPFLVEIKEEEETKKVEFVYAEEYDRHKEERDEAKAAIRHLFEKNPKLVLTVKDALETLKEQEFSRPILDSALKQLVSAGYLEVQVGKSNIHLYSLNSKALPTIDM